MHKKSSSGESDHKILLLKKAHYKLREYNKALLTLKEAIDAGVSVKFAMDAATQRFEYSYELSWNLIKSVLKFKGIELRYPSELFSEAFSAGWITNIDSWEMMITDRNTLAHTYKEASSTEIYKMICEVYYDNFVILSNNLKDVINHES